VISRSEWRGPRREFNQLDINRDGIISRRELSRGEVDSVATSGQLVTVDATAQWTDTGIWVEAGDTITIQLLSVPPVRGRSSLSPVSRIARALVRRIRATEAGLRTIQRYGLTRPRTGLLRICYWCPGFGQNCQSCGYATIRFVSRRSSKRTQENCTIDPIGQLAVARHCSCHSGQRP
jgi:hypothetical protein